MFIYLKDGFFTIGCMNVTHFEKCLFERIPRGRLKTPITGRKRIQRIYRPAKIYLQSVASYFRFPLLRQQLTKASLCPIPNA